MKTKHQHRSQSESVNAAPLGIAFLSRHWRVWLLIVCVGLLGMGLAMSWARVRAAERSEDGLWEQAEQMTLRLRERGEIPARARVFRLEEDLLKRVLASMSAGGANGFEKDRADKRGLMSLPMPEGLFARVRVEEVQVMEAALAARFPEIKNYRGAGIERTAWSLRMTHSPQGLSVFLTDGAETVSIHPREVDGARYYVSAWGQDYETLAGEARCLVGETELRGQMEITRRTARRNVRMVAPPVGATLRKYRLAIATTPQYMTDFGANAQASLTTWVNDLNGIFEKELSVTFMLVTNAGVTGNAQFNGLGLQDLVNKSRELLQQHVGLGAYDLGLVFGSGTTGGLSYTGVVCEDGGDGGGAYKGGGAVLFTTSCGGCDAGNDIGAGMLAHEVGHLFGATHTFNESACGNNGRVGETAFEPGSGLTLMSNAGTCENHNIASARALHFHSGSFEQMAAFINAGGGCATVTNTGNTPPTVTGGAGWVIPRLTPFTLAAAGSDADAGDSANLTYVWEEMDAGGAFPNPPYADQAGDPPGTTRPLFKPFAPATGGASRTFPSPVYIRDNGNVPPTTVGGLQTAENLPGISRQLNFNVTVRDGRGGVANRSVGLDVAEAGPLSVNTPAAWTANTQQTVTWQVNNTHLAPVNCSQVNILFSSDGGNTFGMLVRNAPNDGSETVTVPNVNTSQARIRIEAVGNIFFDLCNSNFSVNGAVGCGYLLGTTDQNFSANGGSGSVGVLTGSGCPWTATSSAAWITINSGASGNGNGTVNYSVVANSGTTRIGTLTIAGKTFTVVQLGPLSGNGLMFYPLPRPVRLLETRNNPAFPGCFKPNAPVAAGTARTQLARGVCDGLAIPADARAVTGNITVVPTAPGSLTLYASDIPRPGVDSSNFKYFPPPNIGEVTNNVFTVALGEADGAFNIYSSATTEVIVDVTGYYAPPGVGGLYFHPLTTPVRLLETRPDFPGFPLQGCFRPNAPVAGTGNPSADPALDLVLQGRGGSLPSPCNAIPAGAQLLVGNATSVTPSGQGYLTIYPGDASRSLIASTNYAGGDIINGPFTVRLGTDGNFDGKFKVFTLQTTDLVIDILGYFSTEAADANGAGMLFNPLSKPVRLLETRAGFPGCYATGIPIPEMGTRTQPAKGTCNDVNIPTAATAIVGNVTVTGQAVPAPAPGGMDNYGYLTLWPGNILDPPLIATSNYPSSSPQGYNRHFFVGLGPNDGTFKLYSRYTTHVRVDVSGYFAP